MAHRECLNHEEYFPGTGIPWLVHGSGLLSAVDEINGLGGTLTGTYGIAVSELQEAARYRYQQD
ncbi:MAG: hypothetical protein ACLTBV_07205 [Enterocloster bolteae]